MQRAKALFESSLYEPFMTMFGQVLEEKDKEIEEKNKEVETLKRRLMEAENAQASKRAREDDDDDYDLDDASDEEFYSDDLETSDEEYNPDVDAHINDEVVADVATEPRVTRSARRAATDEDDEAVEESQPVEMYSDEEEETTGTEMTDKQKNAVAKANRLMVATKFDRTRLQALLNIPLMIIAQAVLYGGSHIMMGAEQSNKTMVIAGIAIANIIMKMQPRNPMVVFVKDVVKSVQDVVSKMEPVLKSFRIETVYASSMKDLNDIAANSVMMNAFLEGRLVIVCAANQDKIRHMRRFIAEQQVKNLLCVLDECDAFFTTATEEEMTIREKELNKLIAGNDGRPFTDGSHVRTLFHISATHIGTLMWHFWRRLPFRSASMDLKELKGRGYAVYDELRPMITNHKKVFLDMDKHNKENKYNMNSDEVREIFRRFNNDTRSNRFMMIIVTSLIDGEDRINNKNIARIALRRVPNAVVLIRSGKGIARYDSTNQVKDFKAPIKNNIVKHPDGKKMTLTEVINTVPANVPVIVAGYACLTRCVSVRGDERVMTHMILAPSKGKTVADMEQMAARGFGFTREQREKNGFLDGIETLCFEEDYNVIQQLYEFTTKMLTTAGTGLLEDLDAFVHMEYEARFGVVTETFRKHTGRKLRSKEIINDLNFAAPPPTAPHVQVEDVTDVVGDVLDPSTKKYKAMCAFYSIYTAKGRVITDVTYAELASKGFRSGDDNNYTIATDMCSECQYLECVRNRVYRLTPKGVATAMATFGGGSAA